jgi:hypothetical protein
MTRKSIKEWKPRKRLARRVIMRSPFKIPIWINAGTIHMPYLRNRYYQAKLRR